MAVPKRVRGVDEDLWFGTYSDAEAERKAAASVAATVGRIVGAKPFPVAASRLAEVTRDPNCHLDQVVRILERDLALSTRVLRLVNSASFALRTPCTSVRHATSLVGTDKLNQLATTAAILDMVDSSSVHASRILEHSAVVGALSRYLAVHLGLPADELFTCGFLHDIGKLMLLEVEGKKYSALLDEVGEEYDAIHLYERELFGFDHALLAGHVLQRWSIPDPVPRVVAWHHHVTRAYDQGPRWASLVSVLRLADLLSYALTSNDDEEQVERAARSEAASFLEISAAQLAAVWDELRSINERSRALFRGEDPPDELPAVSLRPAARSFRPSLSRGLSRSHPSLRPVPPASLAPPASSAAFSHDGPETLARLQAVVAPTSVAIRDIEQRPKQFPCVVCEGPTFAHLCPACHGMVCPEHSKGAEEWCDLCWAEYRPEAARFRLRPILTLIIAAGVGATVVSALFAFLSSGESPGLRAIVGPLSGTVLVAGLVAILHRYAQRAWFLRTRPDRGQQEDVSSRPAPSAMKEEEPPDSGVRHTSEPAAAAESRPDPVSEPPATIAVLPRIAVFSSLPGTGITPSWPPSLVPPSREAEERSKVLRLLAEPPAESPKASIADSPEAWPAISVRPLFGGASITPPQSVPPVLSLAPTLVGIPTVQAADAVAPEQVTEAFVGDQVTQAVAPEQVTEAVATEQVTEAVATEQVTEAVATHQVTEAVATHQVTEAVASDQVAETVATHQVTEGVATDQVTEAVASDQVTEPSGSVMPALREVLVRECATDVLSFTVPVAAWDPEQGWKSLLPSRSANV